MQALNAVRCDLAVRPRTSAIQAFYADVQNLVVLVVDPARLAAPLPYEAAASMPGFDQGAKFPAAAGALPHLYGPLEADAVLEIVDAWSFDLQAIGRAVDPD